MSVLGALRTFLEGYAGMELQSIMTDQTPLPPGGYALAPTGNSRVVEDLAGNKTYRNNFVLFAKAAAADEVDRQGNQDFVEELTRWLEAQDEAENYPDLGHRKEVEELIATNGFLLGTDEDGAGIYQVQIQLVYTKYKE